MHAYALSVLFFSRPRSEGWTHHGRTFSIYPCPLSFWLTLPRRVLSTFWCCPSRPCVAFLAFVHLALFLALSLSPGNSLVSSLCDHSMLASLLWRCLTVPSLLQLVKNPLVRFPTTVYQNVGREPPPSTEINGLMKAVFTLEWFALIILRSERQQRLRRDIISAGYSPKPRRSRPDTTTDRPTYSTTLAWQRDVTAFSLCNYVRMYRRHLLQCSYRPGPGKTTSEMHTSGIWPTGKRGARCIIDACSFSNAVDLCFYRATLF